MLHCLIKQMLQESYPQFEIIMEVDLDSAKRQLEDYKKLQCYFNLVLLDLEIRQNPGSAPHFQNGIELVKALMQAYTPPDNIIVSSSKVVSLVRLNQDIAKYTGGFVGREKFSTIQELRKLFEYVFNLAHNRAHCLPVEVRSACRCNPTPVNLNKIKSRWIDMLKLKKQAYTNQAIALKLGVSNRTVHNYWVELGNCLGVYKTERQRKIQPEQKQLKIHPDQKHSKKKVLERKKDEKDFEMEVFNAAQKYGLIE